jgi:hypothetical protein
MKRMIGLMALLCWIPTSFGATLEMETVEGEVVTIDLDEARTKIGAHFMGQEVRGEVTFFGSSILIESPQIYFKDMWHGLGGHVAHFGPGGMVATAKGICQLHGYNFLVVNAGEKSDEKVIQLMEDGRFYNLRADIETITSVTCSVVPYE